MGIISILLSVLLPTANQARRAANNVQCLSNLRQLATGLIAYASDNNGKFPPNVYFVSPGQFWCDPERVGDYIGNSTTGKKNSVFVCPEDGDARRSYSMNAWVSCRLDVFIVQATPVTGRLWGASPSPSSRIMLLIESWSATGSNTAGWAARPIIGYTGSTPGQRFGAMGGLGPPADAGRWGMVASEVAYNRHRIETSSNLTAPAGRVNIAYVDGHVVTRHEGELADMSSGRSTLESLWSPLDEQQNQ